MSAAAVVLWVLGPLGTLVIGLILAWFSHRLDREATAATRRDDDARQRGQEIADEMRQQSAAILGLLEAQRITTREVPALTDRLTIVESGQHTLHTATELLKQELRLYREWARPDAPSRHSGG